MALTGELLAAGSALADPAAGRLDPQVERVVAEWSLGYGSANTRSAYATDLRHWLTLLAGAGVRR